MIEIKNLRKEPCGEWVKLIADVEVTEIKNPFSESTIWYAVKKEHSEILSADNYNAFFLVPLYVAMYYKTPLKISGGLSERLFKNMKDYGMQIYCNYSDSVSMVDVFVDYLISEKQFASTDIGTGLSCGVDSLYTIYKRFVEEQSENYRINSLYIFNCGTHGDYESPKTHDTFLARYEMNKSAAEDLGLPFIPVDSNLHYYTHLLYGSNDARLGYIALHSCVLALQSKISKYYISNCITYTETLFGWKQSREHDFGEYADPYFIPLVETESLKLVLEGAQYYRSQKTEIISDWNIAKKHLNVCLNPRSDGSNCCVCMKCRRTLIPLDAMGKIEHFNKVFDLELYKKTRKEALFELAIDVKHGDRFFSYDNYNYAIKKGMKMPSELSIFAYRVFRKVKTLTKKFIKNRR